MKSNFFDIHCSTLLFRDYFPIPCFYYTYIICSVDDGCPPGSCATKKEFPLKIVALVSSAVVVVTIVILVFIFVFRKKETSTNVEATSEITPQARITSTSRSETSIETKKISFSHAEVMEMTNNFERALGEVGFGVVYHGYLNGSEQVAVKVLSESSSQGYKHFKAEVELLMRVHHINLVNLVGYCDERNQLALIYEYMSNGDLKHHLSGKNGGPVLNWSTRLQIAVDAALGLEYLHRGCRPSMVHRDVESTNILLGKQFTGKIADFGLSRSFQFGDESHVSTVIAGTPGYLDPEYYRSGRLAEKSNVYSFGIVLLEIITNRQVIDQNRAKPHIREWTAFMLNRGDITKIMDPKLHGDYNSRFCLESNRIGYAVCKPFFRTTSKHVPSCYRTKRVSCFGKLYEKYESRYKPSKFL